MKTSVRTTYVLKNPLTFIRQVASGFRANQGFLLAGAIAYYTLLSIIPMLALILVILSHFEDAQYLLSVLQDYFLLVTPAQAELIIAQIAVFLEHWKVIGLLGILLMLFFSSFAFTALENAMSVIFFHRVSVNRRHFLVSAVIPYIYILLLALGILVVSVVSGFLHSLHSETINLFGYKWSLGTLETLLIYGLGVTGEVILLTSLYLVMPVGKLSFRHALIGGVTATALWELTRHILVWYFSTLSVVNVIYGTFATVIIILVSLEAAALILLLGAQVIAEYERIGNEGQVTSGLQTS